MTLRFYFDEDSMNRALIRALEDRGIDVENAVDAGHGLVPNDLDAQRCNAEQP